jgi:low affinity Fe/Cu permease
MLDAVRRALTYMGELTASPAAFGVLFAYTILWLLLQPETLDWHGAAALVTWLMTLFIQRAGHRDTQALQAKLDELLRVDEEASTSLAGLDKKEPEEIERHRKDAGST